MKVRILTWNIQWGLGDDERHDLARIAEVIAKCDAEVVCLQEVTSNFFDLRGNTNEDQPMFLVQALTGYSAIYGPTVDYPAASPLPKGALRGRRQFGNLILSRLNVGQAFRHLLSWPMRSQRSSIQRGCVEAVLDTPGFRVMTTHLEYFSQTIRLAQIENLQLLHRQAVAYADLPPTAITGDPLFAALPRPAPAILCGDFNFRPDSQEYLQLTQGECRFFDAWRLGNPGLPHPPTFRSEKPEGYCCDFIFLTEELAECLKNVEVLDAEKASDHLPMLLTLDLPFGRMPQD